MSRDSKVLLFMMEFDRIEKTEVTMKEIEMWVAAAILIALVLEIATRASVFIVGFGILEIIEAQTKYMKASMESKLDLFRTIAEKVDKYYSLTNEHNLRIRKHLEENARAEARKQPRMEKKEVDFPLKQDVNHRLRIPEPKQRLQSVYLIRAVSGEVKIGISKDVKSRYQALNNSSPAPLELIGHKESKHARRIESELHERFHSKHEKGEWFVLSESDVEEIIKEYGFTRA